MSLSDASLKELEQFPTVLRDLLAAELAAGNKIVEIGHSFPAPPVGAYLKLAQPVTTRPRRSGDGLQFRDFNSSIYSGEFTDERRFYFILEPPAPPPPEPDMDAIRSASQAAGRIIPSPATPKKAEAHRTQVPQPAPPKTPGEQFQSSMIIGYEQWHDGIGYDLAALRAASPSERSAIEQTLLQRGARDWRDVEALAALGTTRCHAVLKAALKSGDHAIRAAVVRYAPELVAPATRVASLVRALGEARFYEGLTEALEEVITFHPPEVMSALFRGVLERQGEGAVHFAAMLLYLHGQAPEPFDWNQRPFFLKFHTVDRKEREVLFRELCARVGVDPEQYLRPQVAAPVRKKKKSKG